jgi:hypothetical protein
VSIIVIHWSAADQAILAVLISRSAIITYDYNDNDTSYGYDDDDDYGNYDRLMVRRMMIRMMLMMAVKVNDDVDDV